MIIDMFICDNDDNNGGLWIIRSVLMEAVNAVLPPACPMCGKPAPFAGGMGLIYARTVCAR